jgi:hypothetical protein
VVFDFGGYADPRIQFALEISDYVIIPTKVESQKERMALVQTIQEVLPFNENILIVANMVKGEGASEIAIIETDLKANFPDRTFPILPLKSSTAFKRLEKMKIPISAMGGKGDRLLAAAYRPVVNNPLSPPAALAVSAGLRHAANAEVSRNGGTLGAVGEAEEYHHS